MEESQIKGNFLKKGRLFSIKRFFDHGGRRSIAEIAQYSIMISTKESPFYKEIPLNLIFLHFDQKLNSPSILNEKSLLINFHQKNETAFIFTKEIPFKNESDQKKGSPKN